MTTEAMESPISSAESEEPKNLDPLQSRAPIWERFGAFMIDYAFLGVVALATAPILVNYPPRDNIEGQIAFLVNILCMCLKDVTGRSLGKRIRGLRIVKKKDSSRPNPLQLIVRNLFVYLGAIEIIAIFSTEKNERLGDLLTRTVVVKSK